MHKDDDQGGKKTLDLAADDENTKSNRHVSVMQLRRRQYKRLFYWRARWPDDGRTDGRRIACWSRAAKSSLTGSLVASRSLDGRQKTQRARTDEAVHCPLMRRVLSSDTTVVSSVAQRI